VDHRPVHGEDRPDVAADPRGGVLEELRFDDLAVGDDPEGAQLFSLPAVIETASTIAPGRTFSTSLWGRGIRWAETS